MPKISKKYYRRTKESTDTDINIVETLINTSLLHSNDISFLFQNNKRPENLSNENHLSNILVDSYSEQIDNEINDYNFESGAIIPVQIILIKIRIS